MEWLGVWEGHLLLELRKAVSCDFLDQVMIFVSRLGDNGLIWIGLGVIFLLLGLWKRSWQKRGLLLLFSLAANALICNQILKPLVGRTRPYDLLGYTTLIPPVGDPSFPSGHTSASFAAATALYAMDKRWGIAAYGFAALMGFSRLYLGVHFPTDVIVGAGVGVGMAKAVQYFFCKIKNKTSYF